MSLADIEDASAVGLDWLLEMDSTVQRARNDQEQRRRAK